MNKFSLILIAFVAFTSCKKTNLEATINMLNVTNSSGQAQANTKVRLFYSENDLIKEANSYLDLYTNGDGNAVLPQDVSENIICLATKNNLTSEFVALNYSATQDAGKKFKIVIDNASSGQLLYGHGSKKWLMTSYSINGTSQAYVVTSTINSDGTWTDTNNNSGTWHFTNNNTQLVYDYTSSGMTVIFDVTELRKDYIKLDGNMSGIPVSMEMIAVY